MHHISSGYPLQRFFWECWTSDCYGWRQGHYLEYNDTHHGTSLLQVCGRVVVPLHASRMIPRGRGLECLFCWKDLIFVGGLLIWLWPSYHQIPEFELCLSRTYLDLSSKCLGQGGVPFPLTALYLILTHLPDTISSHFSSRQLWTGFRLDSRKKSRIIKEIVRALFPRHRRLFFTDQCRYHSYSNISQVDATPGTLGDISYPHEHSWQSVYVISRTVTPA